ncbi:unnamed protein product, partial [Musa hybrid cultivar]
TDRQVDPVPGCSCRHRDRRGEAIVRRASGAGAGGVSCGAGIEGVDGRRDDPASASPSPRKLIIARHPQIDEGFNGQ